MYFLGLGVKGLRSTYLVDLVDHPEGALGEFLQRHQVEHGGDAPLTAALMERRQHVQRVARSELHLDLDSVLVVIALALDDGQGRNLVKKTRKAKSDHEGGGEGGGAVWRKYWLQKYRERGEQR